MRVWKSSVVNIRIKPVRLLVNPVNDYTARLARDAKEVKVAQALRFQVFNLELKGGLDQSYLNSIGAVWDIPKASIEI